LDNIERTVNNYLLTGNTGSLRYMAPEVAKDEPYNLAVDSYSFGILFWQICALQTPYAGYSQQLHALQVVQRGHRPKPDKSWPLSWVTLMTAAWSPNAPSRPPATELAAQLAEMVQEMAEEDGVVPSRASEIRGKKKRKKVSRENHVLDVDTRIGTSPDASNGDGVKHYDADIV
jgi:serine/threonine protein kinase